MNTSSYRQVNIMLVEDNQGDILLTKIALDSITTPTKLHLAMSGEEAMKTLEEGIEGNNTDSLPDLIFLDLNLPQMSGLDVLQQLKQHDRLKYIPVIILSTSRFPRDVIRSYQNHVNNYITKPKDIEEFKETMMALEKIWFQKAILPDSEDIQRMACHAAS